MVEATGSATTRECVPHRGLRRFLASAQQRIKRSPDNARVGRLSVAKLAGGVDVFVGQAEVGDRRDFLPFGKEVVALPPRGNLAPFLRRFPLRFAT